MNARDELARVAARTGWEPGKNNDVDPETHTYRKHDRIVRVFYGPGGQVTSAKLFGKPETDKAARHTTNTLIGVLYRAADGKRAAVTAWLERDMPEPAPITQGDRVTVGGGKIVWRVQAIMRNKFGDPKCRLIRIDGPPSGHNVRYARHSQLRRAEV